MNKITNSSASNAIISIIINCPNGDCIARNLTEKTQFTIGAEPNNDLVLDGKPPISQYQIELNRRRNYFFVTNCSGSIPTRLNGRPIPSFKEHDEPLHDQDKVEFGGYELVFRNLRDTLRRVEAAGVKPKATSGKATIAQATPNSEKVTNKIEISVQAQEKGLTMRVGTLSYRNRAIELTRKSYDLVALLASVYPEPYEYEQLEDRLYPLEFDSAENRNLARNSLQRQINTIRNKLIKSLGEEHQNLIEIENVHGFGYKLILNDLNPPDIIF